MSYNLDINKPSGKTSQIYYFKHPWEPKHTIGKQHCKRREFLQNEGIAEVEKVKPPSSKGEYVKSVYISSTMGPSVSVDINI